MTKFVQLSPRISVAGQLSEADFCRVANNGFRSVVNARPDGEADDQLPNERAEIAAHCAGLAYKHMPLHCFDITDDDVIGAYTAMLAELPGPILTYCRTGTRCSTIWCLMVAHDMPTDDIIAITRDAGYDLEDLRDYIEDRAAVAKQNSTLQGYSNSISADNHTAA